MHGSTSTCVPRLKLNHTRPFTVEAGLKMSKIVWEGFQAAAEVETQPQSVSVASEVSSKTLISTFSVGLPFLVVTSIDTISNVQVLRI